MTIRHDIEQELFPGVNFGGAAEVYFAIAHLLCADIRIELPDIHADLAGEDLIAAAKQAARDRIALALGTATSYEDFSKGTNKNLVVGAEKVRKLRAFQASTKNIDTQKD